MTGAAAVTHEADGARFELEVRSVNHRFLKVALRVEGRLPRVEPLAEAAARQHLERGHVNYHLRYTPPAGDALAAIDEEAFRRGAEALVRLAADCDLAPVRAADVVALPGVLRTRNDPDDEDALTASLTAVFEAGTRALVASREREGAALVAELRERLAAIETVCAAIEARAGDVPDAVRVRVRERLAALLEGTGANLDAGQLERELAWMAERADVREELARLAAHVAHARELLAAGGRLGKRLDFLAQELHRETNTIGSKAQDLELARHVLALKAEVERVREQVQNVE
jgi:uncharacterized protein (TIGR00255 family)